MGTKRYNELKLSELEGKRKCLSTAYSRSSACTESGIALHQMVQAIGSWQGPGSA
jgi:hypothetical protein